MNEYLKDKNYPVYSIGCMYKNNTTELENLFAISRLTNANYYLLDDYEDYSEIVDGINEKIQRIIFEVPEEYRNGSEQNVLITMETEGPAIELSGKYSMPFDIEVVEEPVVEEIVEEPVVEEIVEEEPVVEEVIIEEPVQEEAGIDFVTIGAIGIIVIALIVLLVMKLTKKKDKQPKNVSMNNMYQQPVPPMGQPMPPMGQPMSPMGQPMAAFAEEEGTVLLNSNRKTLNMRDRNSGKMFSYPISAEGVVIGRNRDGGAQIAINYSALISRKHCKILVVGSRNYIEDLGSSNGTFVNGRPVQSRTEFNNGDIIKLGDVEMEVTVNS